MHAFGQVSYSNFLDLSFLKSKLEAIISFTSASERIKYLGIPNGAKGLYLDNYKVLKETEDEGFLGCSVIKNPAANAGVTGSVPHPGRCHMQPSM